LFEKSEKWKKEIAIILVEKNLVSEWAKNTFVVIYRNSIENKQFVSTSKLQ
jgi:hypothetical protein